MPYRFFRPGELMLASQKSLIDSRHLALSSRGLGIGRHWMVQRSMDQTAKFMKPMKIRKSSSATKHISTIISIYTMNKIVDLSDKDTKLHEFKRKASFLVVSHRLRPPSRGAALRPRIFFRVERSCHILSLLMEQIFMSEHQHHTDTDDMFKRCFKKTETTWN